MDYDIEKIIEKMLNVEDITTEEKCFGEEIKYLICFIKEQNIEKSFIKDEEELENIVYNYVIEWAVWCLVMQSEKIKQDEREIYCGFCLQISNTLLSIYKLTRDGLDYQAMCLVRVLLEMCITFLAILLDDDVKKSYYQTKDLKREREIWKKKLRYNKLLKIVLEYCKDVASDVFLEDPKADKIHEEMYNELSRYEHNSYLNIFLFNYACVDDERLVFNFLGNKVTRKKVVFDEVLTVMIFINSLFFKVLIEKCILPEIDIAKEAVFSELQAHAILLHCLIEELTYEYYEEIQGLKM